MRTSIKLFLSTMLLMAVCLFLYDWKVAAIYRKGDYTNPYFGYTKLNYRDFDEVELRSATSINIMLVQGDFKVLEHPQAQEFAVIRQEGRKLIIEARFRDRVRGVNAQYRIFISCPVLSGFITDTKYKVGSDEITDYENWSVWWLPTVIRGFHEDSLTIREQHASNLLLEGNHFKRLSAVVGEEANHVAAGVPGVKERIGAAAENPIGQGDLGFEDRANGPMLTLGAGNQFDSSNLDILSKSRLWIKGTDIRQLTYHLADSASLTVNGVSARYLNQH